jgi:hypothetical protein
VLNADGTVSYTPDANYFGARQLHLPHERMARRLANVATVSITITTVNDAPIAATTPQPHAEGTTASPTRSNDCAESQRSTSDRRHLPVARDDLATTDEDQPLLIAVLANDSDARQRG